MSVTTEPVAPAAPVEAAIPSAPAAPLTTEERVRIGWDDGSTADAAKFDAAVAQIAATMPLLYRAENEAARCMTIIANAVIDCRSAVMFKGKPDIFGQSAAYRSLFEERIVRLVVESWPKDAGPVDRDWIGTKLNGVRNNYINHSATRSKGMLEDRIAVDAVYRGEIKGATITDGRVVIKPTTKDGSPQTVKRTVEVNGEKTRVEEPLVIEWRPGDATFTRNGEVVNGVPDVLKAPVREAVQKLAPKTKQGVPRVSISSRFGGAEVTKGTGGDTKDNPPNNAEAFRKALAVIVAAAPNVSALERVRWFHASATAVIDSLNTKTGTKSPAEVAQVCSDISSLFKVEGALLTGHANAKIEQLDKFRYVPEDDDKDGAKLAATVVKGTPDEDEDDKSDPPADPPADA